MLPVDEPTCGVWFALPVVDPLDESDALGDVLAFVLDFALAGDDGLFSGLDADLVEAVDTWPRVGVELVQLGLGVGLGFLSAPAELVLALGDTVGVGVGLLLGLALGLALELLLALAEAPGELAVLLLDDVAGAVTVPVTLLGELVVADAVA